MLAFFRKFLIFFALHANAKLMQSENFKKKNITGIAVAVVESSGAAESVPMIVVVMMSIVTMTMMKLMGTRRSDLVESLLFQLQPAPETSTAQCMKSREK